MSEKLFIGPKIKTIRVERGLTQANLAKLLNISTSYMNQLENNQRHASGAILMALAQNLSIDIRTLSDTETNRLRADLIEAIKDPIFATLSLSDQELRTVIRTSPKFARAFLDMHNSSKQLQDYVAETDQKYANSGAQVSAYDEVRDFYHYKNNYFDTLDKAAETLAFTLKRRGGTLTERLMKHLSDEHGIQTKIGGLADFPNAIRHFHADGRTLHINPNSANATQAFHIAHHIALLEQEKEIERLAESGKFRTHNAKTVCKIGLANYFAGSVLLPYKEFLEHAALFRYDLDLLANHFQSSLEQVSHRLSTLQRPELKGIPFFFARVDRAGNITKRHSATKLQFARFGSACPLWNVHQAFETPGRLIRQLAETPDGEKYLCIATAISTKSGGFRDPVRRFALALGCEIQYLDKIIYGDDLNPEISEAYEPIGISCRICERKKCHQRSMPPIGHELKVNPERRNILPYEI